MRHGTPSARGDRLVTVQPPVTRLDIPVPVHGLHSCLSGSGDGAAAVADPEPRPDVCWMQHRLTGMQLAHAGRLPKNSADEFGPFGPFWVEQASSGDGLCSDFVTEEGFRDGR